MLGYTHRISDRRIIMGTLLADSLSLSLWNPQVSTILYSATEIKAISASISCLIPSHWFPLFEG